ncbi:MAG: hypothetical protein ACFFE5_12760 [Candidatus Thorarchaeota archaeon]
MLKSEDKRIPEKILKSKTEVILKLENLTNILKIYRVGETHYTVEIA